MVSNTSPKLPALTATQGSTGASELPVPVLLGLVQDQSVLPGTEAQNLDAAVVSRERSWGTRGRHELSQPSVIRFESGEKKDDNLLSRLIAGLSVSDAGPCERDDPVPYLYGDV
jgi:hypothetical protein